jgi:Rps23 Pro-64 3,4-dihydroxylase Tpa1-like proline 4-hydroxylase
MMVVQSLLPDTDANVSVTSLVKSRIMSNQPVIIENLFSPEELDKILYYCYIAERQSNAHTGITGAFGVRTSLEADKISRGEPIVPLTGDAREDESIWAITEAFLRSKAEVEKFFGQEMSFTNAMYAGMPEGTKNPLHYDNHSIYNDKPNNEDEESEWSAILYLNECGKDYEGGQIRFPKQDLTIAPKAGMLVLFEGTLEYPHEVLEVTSGHRRTLVLFLGKKGNVSDRALFLYEVAGTPEQGADGSDPNLVDLVVKENQ